MYQVKSRIFLGFSRPQKTALCNFLKALVKKMPESDADEVLNKFLEDESYYLKMNSSRFEFLEGHLDEDKFVFESKLFIKACQKHYDYKKSQAPLIQAQKEFEKKKREFLQDVKMSKENATKKQISYYNSLCKRYNLEKKTKNDYGKDLSKLDLRNMIEEVLNEHKAN